MCPQVLLGMVQALAYFQIHDEPHHSIGTLMPDDGPRPEYAQLFILDTVHDLQNLLQACSSVYAWRCHSSLQIQAAHTRRQVLYLQVQMLICHHSWWPTWWPQRLGAASLPL